MPHLCRFGMMLMVMMVLTAMPGHTFAQMPEISRNILQGDQLSASDRDMIVRLYVQPRVRTIQNSGTDAMAARELGSIRTALTTPLRPANSSTAFRREYTRILATQFAPLMESDQPLVRMNAMIVLSSVDNEAVHPLLIKGLQDPSDAVKYWAARATADIVNRKRASAAAIARAAGDPAVNPADEYNHDLQRQLIQAITASVNPESGADFVEQAYRALGELSVEQVVSAIIGIMNARVAMYMEKGFTEDARIEQEGLRAANNTLSRVRERFRAQRFIVAFGEVGPAQAGPRAFNEARQRYLPLITQLAEASGRLTILAAAAIADPQVPSQTRLEALVILDQSLGNYRSLQSMLSQSPANVPGDFASEARAGNIPLMRLYISDWITEMPGDVSDAYKRRLAGN